MGSAASAVSTDSAIKESQARSDKENGENSTESRRDQDLQATSEVPGTSHSSVAPNKRRGVAPSRRSRASDGGRSHRSGTSMSHLSTQHSRNAARSSMKELREDPFEREPSIGLPSPAPSINEEQKTMVRDCLNKIEEGLVNSGVHLNVERVLPYVETITRRDDTIIEGEALLKTNGIHIVQEGVLDLCAADGKTVTQRLELGDFFGELSVLFRVPSSREVHVVSSEVTLLHLPADVVRECASVDAGCPGFNKEVMLNWCVKRSYLESSEIFGHKVLSHRVVVNCLEASVLSDLSPGAMDFIAELALPILFDPGDLIYNSGDEPNYVFLILKGRVHILRGENIVDTKTVTGSDEGCCLGHLEFFSGVKLNYTGKAAGPVIVALVSKEILIEMLSMFPGEMAALQRLLSKHKINN